MEYQKVKAVVIGEKSYKESSIILDILTKEYGIIGVIAKGSKNLKNNLRSYTTKLTYAEFQINYKEGKLSTLIDASIIDSLLDIRKDLDNKIIKTVGNPKYRLKEDSLRILRAIRFATVLGFNIDDKTRREIIEKFCKNEEYEKFNFNIDELMSYPTD